MALRIEDEGAYFRALSNYWRQVNHSEGFDIEDVSEPHGIGGLFRYDCQREDTRVLDELTGYLTLQGGFGYLFGEEAAVERSMTSSSFAFDDELPPITLPTRPINLHLYKWK
ncbi:unnamed protein product [Arabidopsis arenosa]|uniref:Uncharacterized protein n=1 Tax=Arabidopsis arenosa TaxID=38785 RepID=A0A8S2B537_ARAAE|nr:unnamed protein product [Arabidopsis arenosa]